MQRAFPDSLDLMLICVESGMSIEHAFRKVGQEIGVQSRRSPRSSRSRRRNCPICRIGARPITILSRAPASTA